MSLTTKTRQLLMYGGRTLDYPPTLSRMGMLNRHHVGLITPEGHLQKKEQVEKGGKEYDGNM